MSSFAVRRLTEAPESAKFDEVVECFKEAFAEDDFVRTLTGGKTDVYHHLNRSVVLSGLLSGEVYVVEEATNGEVMASAIWFPPNRELYEDTEKCKAVRPLMASLGAELGEWWCTRFLPEYTAFADAEFGEGVKKDAWHLQWIGTRKPYRRRGLAAMLIDVIRDKKGDAKMCLEVENPENLGFYQKCGFEKLNEEAHYFEGYKDQEKSGFPMWAMMSD
ncbi:uncharacterized protein BT62DRAFT_915758 [Guyanagaster necrorhizus]|uniref:N-acetyltransferase domain-containing protein n=1 Tax=Guyanagaster necrorhizus TaxID=856835 RepID=A0A9P8AXN6_9AGAR|nr:uncharacterized protein BT62DRAFT_915758 [Guyanagaster necrorhizus MCA 3950]KAG7451984.1 hypothetical protein BT62DRAFT_915758 [Guyanagaster necrorhizus MCA 3950]